MWKRAYIQTLENLCLALHKKMWTRAYIETLLRHFLALHQEMLKRAYIEILQTLYLALHQENLEMCLYRDVGGTPFSATSRRCRNLPIKRYWRVSV